MKQAHPIEPANGEWVVKGKRYWYEERPFAIMHYYPALPDRVSVFASSDFQPNHKDVIEFVKRGFETMGEDVGSLSITDMDWTGSNLSFILARS